MKKMSKKRIKGIVDLTINDDETFPFASTPASRPESRGSNKDFFDLTGEEETVPCAPPPISQQQLNLVKSHNDAIDLTDDNTESCTLASRSPQPTTALKETLSTSKSPRTAVSSNRKASLTGKLTPMLAAQPSNELLDYNKHSWHNNTTYHPQMSQSEHLDIESKRLALILLSSLNKKLPVVDLQKHNKTPFNIDIYTEVPYSGDVNLNNLTLDANNVLKVGEISKKTMTKDSLKCKKRAIKATITKKKFKNIDFKLKETETYQTLIQKQMEGNKIDFKKNSNLEGMIIRNGVKENRAHNNKTVAKLECKDKQCNSKTKKSNISDFKPTRDESRIILNSEIQKEVAVVPKSILKPTSTRKEDLRTRIQRKRDSDRYKKSNTAKVTKPRGQITKRQNKENCKKSIQARYSGNRLKEIEKKLKKFNTKITPHYSNEKKPEEYNSTKKEDENVFIPTTLESMTSKDNVTAILSQERKQFKTMKKVRFCEEIVSNKPTSKLKSDFKDKLGNKQKPKRTDNQKSPKTISKNKFSYTATKSCDSETDKNNVSKTTPKIILPKLLAKPIPLNNETPVLNPTRKRNFASNSSNGQNNQNTQNSFDHNSKNPTVPSKTLNPSVILNNNETIPNRYESKSELPSTDLKINYPARKSIQHQEVNKEVFDLGSFCRNKQTALISMFGLPDCLHHNLTAATDNNSVTSSTNATKKRRKRTYSLTNTMNTHSDLTKKSRNPQPSSSKQHSTTPAAAAGRKNNSKKKQQSQEIPPVVTSENIDYHIYNIINTMTQNAFKPTLSNKNTMPQPQSTKQSKTADLTNVAVQQVSSNNKQSQDKPSVFPSYNNNDLISFISTMTDNILESSLPNQHSEVKKTHTVPQSCSSKQVNVTTPATALLQQINLKTKQSQEQRAVVTSENNENYKNSFSTMRDSTSNCTLPNQHYELSNSQPTSSIQSTNTASRSAAPQQLKSCTKTRKQSRKIVPVVTSGDINNYKYSFNTMKHNDSFTLPKRNDELRNLLPSSSKQFTSAAYTSIVPQQLNSEMRQSREIPPVVTSDNFENYSNSYNATKHTAFNSTLQKLYDELSNPQRSMSKQFTSATYTSIAPQQLNSERRQSREIPPVVTSDNVDNYINSYNAMKHSAFNSNLQKQNDKLSNPQICSSKQSTNATSTSIASQQLNSQKRQFREIPPVATFDDVYKCINNFNAMGYNAHNFIFPNQSNELCHSEPSSLKQSTKAASTTVAAQQAKLKRRQSREIPPVTPDYVEHFKNHTNVIKDYLTVNRSDKATVQPKASNTHKLYERQPDESTVNMNLTSINCQNTYKSLIQHLPVQQMVKRNQYQKSNDIPNLKTGGNYHRMPSHFNTIPQNATNYVKNGFKQPLEKSPSKAYINASRPPGLCNVLPENIQGSNLPSFNYLLARPPLPPFYKPWNSLSSTHQSSGRADIKIDMPSEKCSDQEAHKNGNMLVSSPVSDKSEEVVTNKTKPCDLLSSNSAPIDGLERADLKRNPSLEKRVDHEEQITKGNMLVFCHSLQNPCTSEHYSEEIMNNKIQTPPLKPCDSSSNCSTSIDNSEQADLTKNLSLEKREDKEAQSSNRDVLNGDPGLDKPEPALKEILLDENVLPLSNNDEVQKTLLCDDDGDTKSLLCLIDSFIDSP